MDMDVPGDIWPSLQTLLVVTAGGSTDIRRVEVRDTYIPHLTVHDSSQQGS